LNNFAFIFARAGSKRIKNKNLQKIKKKSLLEITISQAQKIKSIHKIFLSTDSKKIASVGKSFGIEIIMRPKVFARDKSSEWYAWQHAINHVNKSYEFSKFICLPVTSPLRSKKDITDCIKKLDKNNDMIITITETERNPWFNMVKFNKNKKIEIVNSKKSKIVDTRQKAPKVFDMTTVCYVGRPNYILQNKSIFSGKVNAVVIPKERSLDIDTIYDLKLARLLYLKK
jgi:N,N'-diacetyl-8-epilegionaminate cytidylyltransferase